jgi:hypothetical protein
VITFLSWGLTPAGRLEIHPHEVSGKALGSTRALVAKL